jgi:hypothetical protein
MKILLILAVAMGSVLLPGCVFRGRNGDTVAVFPAGHVHSADCGHYRQRDTWHHSDNHRHCDGCGHSYVNGVWIVLR